MCCSFVRPTQTRAKLSGGDTSRSASAIRYSVIAAQHQISEKVGIVCQVCTVTCTATNLDVAKVRRGFGGLQTALHSLLYVAQNLIRDDYPREQPDVGSIAPPLDYAVGQTESRPGREEAGSSPAFRFDSFLSRNLKPRFVRRTQLL